MNVVVEWRQEGSATADSATDGDNPSSFYS